ncbi:helix-turn-helix transcriptional regulator [Micromonospora sp. NPDC005215]|uniref:helix-turn-helix transcriptional regulator n=1 Tax=Micromonospora sp. NPDC005215 TaxID=3157024 RepID=UPI0033BB8B95
MLVALGLDSVAESVYRQMLAQPDWGVTQLGAHLGITDTQVRAALDCLFKMSLVRNSMDRPGALHVVSPDVGLSTALARQQAELARRQQQVAESQVEITRLIDQFGAAHQHASTSAATHLFGIDAVQDKLAQLARETEFEILTFMPGGAQSAAALEHARRNDTELLERGVRIHTVGLESIRNDPHTLAHARFLTAGGAEFRTSPILPPRMILADRRAVLVPIDPADTRKGALHLTGPGFVASMLALFTQVWEIATPLGAAREPEREGLTAQERALLELLGQGLTDEAAAVRLGVSPRTARRMMADLMERLQARSRFEAGLKAAQRGWL